MIALAIAIQLALAPPVVPPSAEPCKDSLDIAIFTSPRWPHVRAPLRIMVVSNQALDGAELAARGPDGTTVPLELRHFGGPPHGWVARIDKPAAGKWRVAFGNGDTLHACQKLRVRKRKARDATVTEGKEPVWRARWKWERDTENLYSLWIEHLFDAPNDTQPTWRPLHEVLRDEKRNLLYDRHALGEDGPGENALTLKPDCADFPYFLRAYFAWKFGLPFGYRPCSRGSTRRAPSCGDLLSNHQPAQSGYRVSAFGRFVRSEVARRVHSSSSRTVPKYEKSDYYPVALTRAALRPGAIFADPYGHILVVAKWVPQTPERPGILFAVDAQPDGTIGRRRFWRGSFLFPEDGSVSGAGFKRLRPVYKNREGAIRAFSNERLASDKVDFGDFSTEQWSVGKDGFYERMDALINPEPMTPRIAWRAALDALTEQVERRVLSVKSGEEYKAKARKRRIKMPEGASIFQTAGPWEDYSTPSRDLRLLIAIQTVIDYPERVVKHPKRFVLPAGKTPAQARDMLKAALMADAAGRQFTYLRSDGSEQRLTVAEVINRRRALEMAYNPNDCPELRWGAPAGSQEAATCVDHAPDAQRRRMDRYRVWFRERRRPVH